MPFVFYEMDFTDYLLLREGWDDKMYNEEMTYRHMTLVIASSMVGGKNIKPEIIWKDRRGKSKVKMIKYGGIEMSERMAMKLERNKKKNG